MTMWLTAVGVLTCAALAACLMPIELTDETFSSTIEQGKPVFVKFYAPWCGHCKRLAPTWDDLNSHYEDSDVTIAKVDCTQYSKVCGDEQVRGYPTLKLFHNGGAVKYEGARDLKSFTDFVDDHISKAPDVATKENDINIDEMGVMHLTDANFADITSKGVYFVKFYAPWCGHCQRLAPTWSDLAAYYNTHNKDVHIVKVDCTENTAICPKYDVRSYPTLILLQDGAVKAQYTGKRELADFIEFITTSLNEQPQADEESVPQVKILTGENFHSVTSAGTTFVKFYAPWCGHCKRLAPTWDQLAEISHSKTGITIAKVDCTVEKDLCETHQIRGYPTLILFKDGSKKADYSGPRDIESLLAFLDN